MVEFQQQVEQHTSMDVLPPSLISREGDELLRLALWAGNIGFWNWELETNDVYLSPIWKAQLGYEDHELPNAFSTWEKLLHPDDAEHSWKVIQEAQANPERVYEIYFRLRHKQGHYRTLLSRGRVYRDSTGKPIRITGCHVDVTELKRIEEELRQSEAKLQLALLAGDMGTWVWDLEKNEVTLDAKERELFGLPPGNKPFHYEIFNRFVHKDDLERVQNEVNKVLTGNGQLNTEFRIVLPGGEVRWLLGAGSLVRDN
ncbi:MAG TPA: PAS domain-containing protein, partial [Gemmatales bacterium]|nr:PAS domain-containing protein [Gemmatales bacterium]